MDRDIPMSIKMGPKSFKAIADLDRGEKIDESPIIELCDFIDYRLDCSDFRLVSLLRILYSYSSLISSETAARMKLSLLGFKYWMDEPGDDSMCYWSENHQILFFTCAYLAGQLYRDEVFVNSGLNGREMMERFKPRILAWMKERFNHGFTEWHSNTYYEEDIPPLTLLIDFASGVIRKKAVIILDLFVADMAVHNFKGLFSVTSGRCYEQQKREPLMQDTLEMMEWLFGSRNVKQLDYSRISSSLYLCRNYEVPAVLRAIAADEEDSIVKTSMGHDIGELKNISRAEGEETADYLQWAMECFTNSRIVRNTMKMYRRFNMKVNDFLKDFAMLDIRGIEFLLPLISKILNPMIDGTAIQKVNSYTFKNKDFILSTAQNHYPGTFGDQQHIWQATINEKLSIFTTHPGKASFDDNARNFSPSYWVGNGIMPHSVQYKNVNLSIYKVDGRKGFMEHERQHFTHAHFPQAEFDRVEIDGRYAFGLKGNVKAVLIGKNALSVNPDDHSDLIQHGKITYWICELSNGDEAFDDFIQQIKNEDVKFSHLELQYRSMSLKYKGDFKIDGTAVDTEYSRLESKYGTSDRCDDEVMFSFNGRQLKLNYEKNIREYL